MVFLQFCSEKFEFRNTSDDENEQWQPQFLMEDKSDFDLVAENSSDVAEVIYACFIGKDENCEKLCNPRWKSCKSRIRLPDHLDSHDWSECGVIEKMEQLAEIVFPALPHN